MVGCQVKRPHPVIARIAQCLGKCHVGGGKTVVGHYDEDRPAFERFRIRLKTLPGGIGEGLACQALRRAAGEGRHPFASKARAQRLDRDRFSILG